MTGKQPRYGSADQLRDIVWTLCHDVEVGEEAFMGKIKEIYFLNQIIYWKMNLLIRLLL